MERSTPTLSHPKNFKIRRLHDKLFQAMLATKLDTLPSLNKAYVTLRVNSEFMALPHPESYSARKTGPANLLATAETLHLQNGLWKHKRHKVMIDHMSRMATASINAFTTRDSIAQGSPQTNGCGPLTEEPNISSCSS